MTPADLPRTIVVLGGGGALGAFQAGALLALAEHGVVADAYAGCSAGALNAAFLASQPGLARAERLAEFWLDPRTATVLAPALWSRLRGLAGAARGRGLLDAAPLRDLLTANLAAHEVSELAVPLSITTTCLDCADAAHHRHGPLVDVLMASCALPGLLPAVRLPDRHSHVDGGIVCGVPIAAALASAGPHDRVLVLDCALAPVTGTPGSCAGLPDATGACGLSHDPGRTYRAPEERTRAGALDVTLRAFTVARAVANRASVADALRDPRVHVLPHVADAWAAGLLRTLPAGPRDTRAAAALLEAGRVGAATWLTSASLPLTGRSGR